MSEPGRLIVPSFTGLGRRSDDVLHACPECTIGQPRPLCLWCGGKGTVPESVLSRWQRHVLVAGAE